MKKAAKALTIISCILSGMLWLLGILTLLFNIWGLWGPWHLAGFGFIFFIKSLPQQISHGILISVDRTHVGKLVRQGKNLRISVRFRS